MQEENDDIHRPGAENPQHERPDQPLEPLEYSQYGRQMLVPQIGLEGQVRLKNAAVAVIGAGGLGSPAIAYLVGAGVGTIGIVDGDTVEVSNLHRQIVHSRATVGTPKCLSAAQYSRGLNPAVKVNTYETHLTSENALEICSKYDLILDCTDSPMSRYLINDTAAILGIPLVSASALKTEGQLAIYNYRNGPCYRCIFPKPPPASSVGACSDAGIIGPVVGIMGVMQAIEAIKIIACPTAEFTPFLLIFNAMGLPPWRHMKIRGKKPDCAVCGESPSITKVNLKSQNYVEFCGAGIKHTNDSQYRIRGDQVTNETVVDVRPAVQFGICHIPGSINIPIGDLKRGKGEIPEGKLAVLCRYGNDSQEAVTLLREKGHDAVDIIGGIDSWGESFGLPKY